MPCLVDEIFLPIKWHAPCKCRSPYLSTLPSPAFALSAYRQTHQPLTPRRPVANHSAMRIPHLQSPLKETAGADESSWVAPSLETREVCGCCWLTRQRSKLGPKRASRAVRCQCRQGGKAWLKTPNWNSFGTNQSEQEDIFSVGWFLSKQYLTILVDFLPESYLIQNHQKNMWFIVVVSKWSYHIQPSPQLTNAQ